jgi:hypothetical protein
MNRTPLAKLTLAAVTVFPVFHVLSSAAPPLLSVSSALQARQQPSTEASIPRLSPVHLDGLHFTRNGKPFIPMGAHWVPAKAAMQWPLRWDPADIEADFAKMQLGPYEGAIMEWKK